MVALFISWAWKRLLTLWFWLNAGLHPFLRPQRGITIVAHVSGAWSFGKTMRDIAWRLKELGVPCQVFNSGLRRTIPYSDYRPLLTPWWAFRSRKYDHVIEIDRSVFPSLRGVKKSTVFFWEFEDGVLDAWPEMRKVSSIVAMSDFNDRVFRRALPDVDVRKILYPFMLNAGTLEPPETVRCRYGIPLNSFVVFFNFSFTSGCGRKNPQGLLRAFSRAFRDVPDAWLVFKTQNAASSPDRVAELRQIAESGGVSDRVKTVDRYLSQNELYALTNACDVYASLHRGEGFGLGVAEAMTLGKAVVVSDCGSTTEFCTTANTLPIPCRLIPVDESRDRFDKLAGVKSWPDPDLDAAATALRRLYDDPELRTSLGVSAQKSVAEHFSASNFGRFVDMFLSDDISGCADSIS